MKGTSMTPEKEHKTGKKRYLNTTYMVLCGLFAALTAICSFITIPLGFTPIPVNFATLAVFLTGGIMGKKYGTISILVYIMLGAVGLPVFAGFKGGLGVLMGPTGGYIIGYAAAVFIIGLLSESFYKNCIQTRKIKYKSTAVFLISDAFMAIGLLCCYTLGSIWFMLSTGATLETALVSCVLPFLPGDAVKIFIASILIHKLNPLVQHYISK
ncbi:MAG: biotin transporter BioY [Anaerovoracaceae bacterium]